MREALVQLAAEVEARGAGIVAVYPEWPCRRGCDACCRRLAATACLTAPEWDAVRAELDRMPASLRARLLERMVAAEAAGWRVCPLLDEAAGACRVYAGRPIACRTYGFYREGARGLCCTELEARVEAGEFAGAVWGNAAGVEARVAAWGPARTLAEWAGG